MVVLAATGWLREPSVLYLATAAMATGVACWAAGRAILRRDPAWGWKLAVGILGVIFCASALRPQLTLAELDDDWAAWEGVALDAAGETLDRSLGEAVTQLHRLMELAFGDDSGEEVDDSRRLAGALARTGAVERSVVVSDDGVPVAWAGTLRIPVEAVGDGLGVVRTPFYDVLTLAATSGSRRVTVTLLLQALPPANEFARSLADEVITTTAAQELRFELLGSGPPPVTDAALRLDDGRWLSARVAPLVRDEITLRTLEGARSWGLLWLTLLVGAFLGGIWRRERGLGVRLLGLAVALAAVAMVPLNALSNVSPLFDPTYYYAALGGPFTATIGALGLCGALALLALLALQRVKLSLSSRLPALALLALVAAAGPFLLRDLARGIVAPASGVPTGLWLAWQTALFLVATAILLTGVSAGRGLVRPGRGVPSYVAPVLAAVAATLAQPLWSEPEGWPAWYPALWIAAVAALALSRRTRTGVMAAAAVGAFGAMTLVWGDTLRGRVELARRDVAGLTSVDPVVTTLLDRLADDLLDSPTPRSREELLAAYASSDLAAADFAVQLGSWNSSGDLVATLAEVVEPTVPAGLMAAVAEARVSRHPTIVPLSTPIGQRLALAVPDSDGRVTTVMVAARTRLFPENPYSSILLGRAPPATEPPYTISLAPAATAAANSMSHTERWERRGDVLMGDWLESLSGRDVRVHVEVEFRSLADIIERGILVLLLDLSVVWALWAIAMFVEPGAARWIGARRRRWTRSFRARLSLTLVAFFALPAAVFGIWASRQLRSDARQMRELLVGEALRTAAPEAAVLAGEAPPAAEIIASHRGDPPMLLYEDGLLAVATDDLLASLAPLGRLLPPEVAAALASGTRTTTSGERRVGRAQVLVGYRALVGDGDPGLRPVLAVPARPDEVALERRRRDLGVLVLLALAGGALAATWLSAASARQLARPISSLRTAALAIASGELEPPLSGPEPPSEFQPVFSAFRRMAADLSASRSALEEAERRTTAVLRQVASAVVAVDPEGRVTLFNPAATLLFGRALQAGVSLSILGVPTLVEQLRRLTAGATDPGGEEVLELALGQRQVHARITSLRSTGGAVLTLDDVTEMARAQRVLAWGEMARQVAHEIKNPLTPIRLGVQHLRRAYLSGRPDYERVLGQNVERILAEIDRLDEIARSFSRYGMAPERRGGTPVDVAHVVRDVVELERLGTAGEDDGASGASGEQERPPGDIALTDPVIWSLSGAELPVMAIARADELREVLLNLLENARLASARSVNVVLDALTSDGVRLTVTDDGHGIPADVMPRIFDPHFSTRTSGSGLGLAISRRMVESWGGRIEVRPAVSGGTEVVLTLAAAME